jgi:hypothetical protein
MRTAVTINTPASAAKGMRPMNGASRNMDSNNPTACTMLTRRIDVQTRVYEVLQAAVTVIWCISIVILFVDVLVVIRRHRGTFESTKLARPVVFYVCSLLGALAALVGIVATLSGPWTPLIPNDSGSISILGATIAYGPWFYWIAGIATVSLLVGAALYVAGRRRPSATIGSSEDGGRVDDRE